MIYILNDSIGVFPKLWPVIVICFLILSLIFIIILIEIFITGLTSLLSLLPVFLIIISILFILYTYRHLIIKTKIGVFLFATIVVFTILVLFDFQDDAFSWHDILVEAHGLIFDLLVIGVILAIFERSIENREKISRLKQDLIHYADWDDKEIIDKKVSIIKELISKGEKKLYLRECNLSEANLSGLNLSDADLSSACLSGTDLSNTDLSRTNLSDADLMNTDLYKANLTGANLSGVIIFSQVISKYKISQTGKLMDKLIADTCLPFENWLNELSSREVIGAEEIAKKYEVKKNQYEIEHEERMRAIIGGIKDVAIKIELVKKEG